MCHLMLFICHNVHCFLCREQHLQCDVSLIQGTEFPATMQVLTRYLLEKLFGPEVVGATSDHSYMYIDLPPNMVSFFPYISFSCPSNFNCHSLML